MRFRRHERRCLAAWLGLICLAVQALLPLLLAVEIAAQPFDPAAEALCLHSSAAPPQPDQTPHHHSGISGCPICLTLAASAAFTEPTPLALPLPDLVRSDAYAHAEGGPRTQFFRASYRSRAPPQLG